MENYTERYLSNLITTMGRSAPTGQASNESDRVNSNDTLELFSNVLHNGEVSFQQSFNLLAIENAIEKLDVSNDYGNIVHNLEQLMHWYNTYYFESRDDEGLMMNEPLPSTTMFNATDFASDLLHEAMSPGTTMPIAQKITVIRDATRHPLDVLQKECFAMLVDLMGSHEAEDAKYVIPEGIFDEEKENLFSDVVEDMLMHEQPNNISLDQFSAMIGEFYRTKMLWRSLMRVRYFDHFMVKVRCEQKMLLMNEYMARGYLFNQFAVLTCSSNDDVMRNFQRLVGVELNPGPGSDKIVAFLKNMERLESEPKKNSARQSTPSRRTIRQLERNKDASKRTRKQKFLEYNAEAFFEVGLDQETKTYLASTMQQLNEIVSQGVDLKLDFVSNLSSSTFKLFEYIKVNSVFLFDYLKFCFCVLYDQAGSTFKKILELFGELFLGFSPEGVVDSAFMLLMYKDTIGKHFKNLDVMGLVGTIAKLKHEASNASTVFEYVMSVIREITHQINVWFGTSIPCITGDTPLDKFFSRFYELRKMFQTEGISHYHSALALYALHEDVERYYRKNTDNTIRDKIQYLLSCLRPLVAHCENTINPNNGPRVEPLAIIITGPSGVGKSSFTTPTLLALLSRVLSKERLSEFQNNHNDFIFYRATENEFWDGYRSSHDAIVFDDFGQMKDVAGGKNPDAFEIIRLKNTAPYHLHFASINDKQKNYANPRILYATTNRNFLDFKSIVSNEAVIRRFDVSVCQVPKVEFCKKPDPFANPWERRLDLDKVRAKYPYDPKDPSSFLAMDVIEFIEWDFVTGHPKTNGKTYTFSEFLNLCWSTFNVLNTKGDAMLNYHQHIKNMFKPEAGSDTASDDTEYFDTLDYSQAVKLCFDSVIEPKSLFSTDTIKTVVKFTSIVLAMCAVVKLSSKLAGLFSDESNEARGKTKQAKPSKEKNMSKHDRNRAKGKGGKEMRNLFKPQSADHTSLVVKLLKRNIYSLFANGVKVGFIIFLKGTTFVMPKHFNDSIEGMADDLGEVEIKICNPVTDKVCFKWNWSDHLVTYEYDYDIIFCKLPNVYREHSDITSMFTVDSKLSIGDKYVAVMPFKRQDMIMYSKVDVSFGTSVAYAGTSSYLLNYNAESEPGDCGMPLITFDPRMGSPKILGFHTAGSQYHFGRKACVGVAISKEDIDEAMNFCDENSVLVEDLALDDEFVVEGFNHIAKAKPPMRATKSKLIKTKLYGKLYEPITKPAHLTPFRDGQGNLVDPGKKAQLKYDHENPSVPLDILQKSADYVCSLALKKTQTEPWAPKLFSFEEAVSGVDGVPFCDAVSRSTSPGYPFVLDKRGQGKSYWLGKEGKVDFNSQGAIELREMVTDIVDSAKKGIRKTHIFMDCLKDERRPILKVDEGKTRQFMACPMLLLISMKMYFGDFIRSVCQNRIQNGVAVGINVYSEWDDLAKFIAPNSEYNVSAGDYSSFDCKFPTQVSWKVLEIIETFYAPTSTEEDRRVRRVLFSEIINSLHIDAKGNVYEFIGSNPSGQPMTAVFNSIGNLIMLASVYFDQGHDEVTEDLRFTTFGDDHIVGYPSHLEPVLGSTNLAKVLKKLYDYDYTDESKGTTFAENRKLDSVSFLKRQFKRLKGRMYAPLDITVILETLNWCKTTSTQDEFILRAEAVLSELSFHGKSTFDLHASKIIGVVYECYAVTLKNTTYEKAIESSYTLGADF